MCAAMTKWLRTGTIALALALIWFGSRFPIYAGSLGIGGDVVEFHTHSIALCAPDGTQCEYFEAGRGIGGAQGAFSLFTVVLMVFLSIELIQAIREKQLDRLPKWTLIAIGLHAVSFIAVVLLIEGPPDMKLHMSWGMLFTPLGIIPAVIAQTNLYDNFASDEELGLLPQIPGARAIHAPPVVGRTPAVVATTVVTQADFGHAGLRVRTEDGAERRVEWIELRTIALDASRDRPHLDLVTRDGEALRITPTSRVDYRFLPGGVAQNEADNLRRLEQFARERNPAAG
jgi:hypothetical protein